MKKITRPCGNSHDKRRRDKRRRAFERRKEEVLRRLRSLKKEKNGFENRPSDEFFKYYLDLTGNIDLATTPIVGNTLRRLWKNPISREILIDRINGFIGPEEVRLLFVGNSTPENLKHTVDFFRSLNESLLSIRTTVVDVSDIPWKKGLERGVNPENSSFIKSDIREVSLWPLQDIVISHHTLNCAPISAYLGIIKSIRENLSDRGIGVITYSSVRLSDLEDGNTEWLIVNSSEIPQDVMQMLDRSVSISNKSENAILANTVICDEENKTTRIITPTLDIETSISLEMFLNMLESMLKLETVIKHGGNDRSTLNWTRVDIIVSKKDKNGEHNEKEK